MKRLAWILSMALASALVPCIALAVEEAVIPETCVCGASWTEPVFVWEDEDDDTNWHCIAILTCQDEECAEALVYSSRDITNEDGTLNENSPFSFAVGYEAPTCTTEGYEFTTWYLTVCVDGVLTKFETTKTVTYEPAHDWMVSVEWEDYFDAENWNFTVTQWCWGDCGQTIDLTEGAEFSVVSTVEPTCTECGYYEGVVSVEFEGELYEDAKFVEVEPLGHDYGEDGICGRCGVEKESAASAPVIAQTGDDINVAAASLAAFISAGCLAFVCRKTAA